jgi:transposase
MTLHKTNRDDIPLQTVLVARAAFPNGNVYMMMRDELGVVYSDDDFATLLRIVANRHSHQQCLL